jgi:hypothetical protein
VLLGSLRPSDSRDPIAADDVPGAGHPPALDDVGLAVQGAGGADRSGDGPHLGARPEALGRGRLDDEVLLVRKTAGPSLPGRPGGRGRPLPTPGGGRQVPMAASRSSTRRSSNRKVELLLGALMLPLLEPKAVLPTVVPP